MHGKKNLDYRNIIKILVHHPTITSVAELCAIKNMSPDEIEDADKEVAEYLVNRNRLRLQVLLKQELYSSQDPKLRLQLYKLICDEDELERFAIYPKGAAVNTTVTPTIEIKSADPDIINKISKL